MNGPDLRLNFFTVTGMRSFVECCIYVPTNNWSHTLKTAKQKLGMGMEGFYSEIKKCVHTLNTEINCLAASLPDLLKRRNTSRDHFCGYLRKIATSNALFSDARASTGTYFQQMGPNTAGQMSWICSRFKQIVSHFYASSVYAILTIADCGRLQYNRFLQLYYNIAW